MAQSILNGPVIAYEALQRSINLVSSLPSVHNMPKLLESKDKVINCMPLCITFLVIFPSYIRNFGCKSSFLSISLTYVLTRLHRIKDEENRSLELWVRLLVLTARLALTCSALGHLLTSYQGGESSSFHLFPEIPWVMPVTVPTALVLLIALGLQPSSIIKLIFDIIFGVTLIMFMILGILKVFNGAHNIHLDLNFLDEVPNGVLFFLSLFTIGANGKSVQTSHAYTLLWLCLFSLGILAFLNESTECGGLRECLHHPWGWSEPLFLSLSVASLGLCLVDFYAAATSLLERIPEFEQLHTLHKTIHSSTLFVGVFSISLIYFYSVTTLIIITNCSVLICLSLQHLHELSNLVNLSPVYADDNNYLYSQFGNTYDKLNQDPLKNGSAEDSCSDIDAIVEEYKSQIQVVSGEATEAYLRKASCVFKLILTTITIISVLVSLASQIKLLTFGIGMITALIILLFLLQLVTNSINKITGRKKYSIHRPVILYAMNNFLIGYIPLTAWICIIIWTLKGTLLKVMLLLVKKFGRGNENKQFFNIREAPPVFGTSCVPGNGIKKTKIIHA